MEKTIKEWLEEKLPTDIAEKAIKNMNVSHTETSTEEDALLAAFPWYNTEEGNYYWEAVWRKYFKEKADTVIPEPTDAIKTEPAKESKPIRVSTILITMTHYEEGVEMQIERSKDISHYEAIGIYETLCRQHVLHSLKSIK